MEYFHLNHAGNTLVQENVDFLTISFISLHCCWANYWCNVISEAGLPTGQLPQDPLPSSDRESSRIAVSQLTPAYLIDVWRYMLLKPRKHTKSLLDRMWDLKVRLYNFCWTVAAVAESDNYGIMVKTIRWCNSSTNREEMLTSATTGYRL